MKLNQVIVVVAASALAYSAGRFGLSIDQSANAQPGEAEGGFVAAMPGAPGEHHKILEAFNGSWEGVFTVHIPGMDPISSTGTVEREWILDGRFLVEEIHAEMMPGQEFVGYGIFGYNADENRYETFWIDNTSTAMTRDNAKFHAESKTMTLTGKTRNMMGQQVATRGVLDMSNPDRHVFKGYEKTAGGIERLAFESVTERVE